MIRAINKSTRNKELLIKYNGRVLLAHVQTRWIYIYYILNRLLVSKEAVNKVAMQNDLIDLSLDPIKWKQIEQIRDLLKPFADTVTDFEGDNYTTLSRVVPTIIDLIDCYSDQVPGFLASVRTEIKKELETRFAYIFDIKNESFAPVHMLATFYNPEYVLGLSSDQRKACINLIIGEIRRITPGQNEQTVVNSENITLTQKKYGAFFKKAQVIDLPEKENQSKMLKSKLEAYLSEAVRGASIDQSSIDPVNFWASKRDTYGEIAEHALNVLSVPAHHLLELSVYFQWLR